MKKSTQVALSLLVPAMTAFGCSNQSKTAQLPANTVTSNSQNSMTIPMHCSCGHRFMASKEMAGKVVQCPNCDRTLDVPVEKSHSSSYYRPNGSSSYYRPDGSSSYYRPDGSSSYYRRDRSYSYFPAWFGGYNQPSASPPPVASSTHTAESRHVSSTSHVSYSGFGGTGSRFSGGS